MKLPENFQDNDEQFEAWLFDELKRTSVGMPREIALIYDENGNSVIGPKDWLEKEYPKCELFI